jgi:hypothetical protein
MQETTAMRIMTRVCTRICGIAAVAGLMLAIAPQAEARGYHHNFFGFYDDPTAPPLFIPPGCRQVFTPDGHARAVCPGDAAPQQLHRHRHHHRHHHHPRHHQPRKKK